MQNNRSSFNFLLWQPFNHGLCSRIWTHATLKGREDVIPPYVSDGGALLFELETRRVLVRGQLSRGLRHVLPGTTRVGITVRPGVLPVLCGVPAGEIVNAMRDDLPLPALKVPEAAWTDRLAMMLWLKEFMQSCLPLVREKVPCLPVQSVYARVSDWARGLNMTERTLHRRCLTAFALAPKEYLRIARLSRALAGVCRSAKKKRENTLCNVAQDSGYADQAHFCHECRELLDCTPQEAARVFYLFYAPSGAEAPRADAQGLSARGACT